MWKRLTRCIRRRSSDSSDDWDISDSASISSSDLRNLIGAFDESQGRPGFDERTVSLTTMQELTAIVSESPSMPHHQSYVMTTESRQLEQDSNTEPTTISPMTDVMQWRWYWQESDETWKPFTPDSLQQTMEKKYLANQRIYLYSRQNYKWNYSIDFHLMTQTNLNTGTIRQLKRCGDTNDSCQDGIERPPCQFPLDEIDVELPPSWMPWDVAHPFELVLLPHTDPDCIKVSKNFYRTMSPDQHIMQAVFRVQNHILWSAFCNQEKRMCKNQRRLGDTRPVDKRCLFHGTESLNNARGICINNFDFRLCGKNATVYGQGVYFAKDAKYSDCYTKPSTKLERFMFQATVLVGYYTTGKRDYKRPPDKPGKNHELYDSCVDNVDDPSIFILFEKNAYYPEYLIQYNDTRDNDIL